MSYPILALVLFFILYLVSLFGRTLSATRAPLWWIFLLFLLVATLSPLSLLPLARALGIELVSNMVLALAILFLLLQFIAESSAHFLLTHQHRRLVCSLAARTFRLPESSPARVLVLLPCFNEQDSLPTMLPRLERLCEEHPQFTFCFVNDSSTDQTERVLRQRAPANHVSHSVNMGVSGGLLTGFLIAQEHDFDYLVQCDSDGQHPVERIAWMVEQARSRQVDLLLGSRFAPPASGEVSPDDALESTTWLRRLGGIILLLTLRVLFPSTRISDPTSGFRVYSRRAMGVLSRDMPERYPEPEAIAILATHGLKSDEVFVRMSPRTTGQSSISGLGKVTFMIKVISALLGLRLRTLAPR